MKEYWAVPYTPDPQKVKSPLRYPGGKFYALKHIMPYIACVAHDEYREPFLGGGSVFFAKPKANINILNDLEDKIIFLYEFIKDKYQMNELIALLSKEVATKQRHSEIKDFIPTNSLEAAFKTFYLNRTSYCGIINAPAWGYAEKKSSPPKNWGSFIVNASKKLQDVELHTTDFSNIISMPARGQRVLMYLDPPYYHADQKRAYTKPFEINDHIRLAQDLKKTQFLFCLSYDDCTEIRELYQWANIYNVSWLYNTDNKPGEKRKSCKELIITNYKVYHF